MRYCPYCGNQDHVIEGRGAFVEIGEYDEGTDKYEAELGTMEYECTDCKKVFFAD